MKRLFTILAFVVFGKVTNCQATSKNTLEPTTKVINRLAYYWRLDSLAGNGYRLHTVNELLKSKLDKVSQNFLLEKFGKPNQLRKTNHGIEYIYFYFDIKAMPKDYDAPMACAYIAFQFKTNEEYAAEMVEGDMDR